MMNEEGLFISKEEYQDIITKCADYDSICSIAAHILDPKVAIESIRTIIGLWGD